MKHKHLNARFIMLICLCLFLSIRVDAQGWEWARSVNKLTGGGSSEAVACATDNAGNVYGTGYCFGTFYVGHDTFTNFGGGAAYLVKYDSSGNYLWGITTHTNKAYGLGLAVDPFNNIYLFGGYDSSFQLGGFTLTSTHTPKRGYFIAKIASTGSVQWVKSVGTVVSYFNLQTSVIACDNGGNIYVSCPYAYHATIGAYSFTADTTGTSSDILVAKFDSSGGVIWAKSFGGNSVDWPTGISVTPLGNIYISGDFKHDTLVFGSTSLIDTSTSVIHWKTFLAKLDNSGNPIWARSSGGQGSIYTYGFANSPSEDIFVTGCYSAGGITIGSLNFPAPPPYTNYGFLAKYDSSGNAVWLKRMQGNYIIPFNATVDPCDNVWMIGSMGYVHMTTNDTIDGHILVPPAINGDPNFMAGWSSSGTFISASAIASGSFDDPNNIASDKCGNIYVIADQEDCDTLIIARDTFLNGGEDMFLAKYNPNLRCGICYNDESVNKVVQHIELAVYPNPATSELEITSTQKIKQLSITDLLGQNVFSREYNAEKVQVDLADLPAGLYLIRINGIEVRRFVKE